MEIRVAGTDDALAVETVRVGTWKTAYRGMVPDAFLDGLIVDAERRAVTMSRPGPTTLIAFEGALPVAMAVFGPCRDEDRTGELELFALYVELAHWGSGVGSALLDACGDVTSLWVLEQNVQARAFYAGHDFAPDGSQQVLDLGAPVVEVRMVRPSVRASSQVPRQA